MPDDDRINQARQRALEQSDWVIHQMLQIAKGGELGPDGHRKLGRNAQVQLQALKILLDFALKSSGLLATEPVEDEPDVDPAQLGDIIRRLKAVK